MSLDGIASGIDGDATERPPVLLTHGFGASSAMWSLNVGPLAEQRQVLTWDLPGHGSSQVPGPYSHGAAVETMRNLLDEAAAERAVLGGMSLGGYLSLCFFLEHPERVAALLLVDTGPGYRSDEAREGWNAWANQLADDLEREGLSALPSGAENHDVIHVEGATGLAKAARGILTQRDSAVIDSLPDIAVPTLIVVGADDTPFLGAADVMEARIPGSRKIVIPDAGHAANIDRPDQFNAAVRSFLEGV